MLDLALLFMAALLGFSAHRAGLCTVKAVAEVLTSRTGWLLASFAKSAGWVFVLTALGSLLAMRPLFFMYPVTWTSIAGGFLFGLGAALNGGCSFSSLTQLSDGRFRYAITIAMWPVGMAMAIAAGLRTRPESPLVAAPDADIQTLLGLYAVSGLLFWAALELGRIVLEVARRGNFLSHILSPSYKLSSAALLIGISNSVIVYNIGNWSFTSSFLCLSDQQSGIVCDRPWLAWTLLGAAFAGMLASTLQRGSFRASWPSISEMVLHAVSGLMMGFGAAAIPGGNDGLILFGIPSLSMHAMPAFLAILAGIWVMLASLRRLGRTVATIECGGDICRTI